MDYSVWKWNKSSLVESQREKHWIRKAALMRQKGYPITLLKEAFGKADAKIRSELLLPAGSEPLNNKMSRKSTFLTTTYTPSFDGLRPQVEKTWDLLDRANSTRPIHKKGLTVGYRRPKNLRDMLVRARLPPSEPDICWSWSLLPCLLRFYYRLSSSMLPIPTYLKYGSNALNTSSMVPVPISSMGPILTIPLGCFLLLPYLRYASYHFYT